ncbi:MAG: ABC transporter permease [Salinivirgaceae bacterium]|nr:ABC transporter permease [Salinivirgaceae bacterium]
MKSNVLTIIKKEFDRVFRDRQLMFTTIILPGLLIYFIYSFMGSSADKMVKQNREESVTVQVDNLPQSVAQSFNALSGNVTLSQSTFGQAEIDALKDKNVNTVLVRFPADFDAAVSTYTTADSTPAPNVEIYYNSTNEATQRIYSIICGALGGYEESIGNRFDINRADSPDVRFNQANDEQVSGQILGRLLPMLILIMLFSGVMSVAQNSIAGEKERGTIATLLVTPMHRSELAFGKIVAISGISLLSAISSFIGIVLSLPNMIGGMGVASGAGVSFNYGTSDYIVLLAIIISTVLIMAAIVSILSTLAKDVKNAASLCMPLMLVMVFLGIISMLSSDISTNTAVYLIPFYNSTLAMTALLQHELALLNAVVTVGANIAYTVCAVLVLTKMFNNEKVMFNR